MMPPGPTSSFLQGSGFPSEDPHYGPKEETTREKIRPTIGRPAGSPLKIPGGVSGAAHAGHGGTGAAQWWAGPTLVALNFPREIHATYSIFRWTTRPSSLPSTEGQAIDGDKVSLSATKEGSVRFVRRTAGTQ